IDRQTDELLSREQRYSQTLSLISNPELFKTETAEIPTSYQRPFCAGKQFLRSPRYFVAGNLFDPAIFTPNTRNVQSTSKAKSKLLQLLSKIFSHAIKAEKPDLQKIKTGSSHSFTIFERPNIAELKHYRIKLRFQLLVGTINITQAIASRVAIKDFRIGHESDTLAGGDYTAEILSVIV